MLDHYIQVRELFAGPSKSELASLFKHPFTHRFPLTQALSRWHASLNGEDHPPLLQDGIEMLSVAQQCELALIWAAMREPAAGKLAARVLPLVEHGITTMWASDKEEGDAVVFALFLRALGRNVVVPSTESSPFFAWIESQKLSIELENAAPQLPYTLFRRDDAVSAIAHVGRRTSLGAMCFGPLSIRAFGFQALPFSDTELFGSDAFSDHWHRMASHKEVWAQVMPQELGFSVQTVGLSAQNPIFLSFYVVASECRIGAQVLKPKSLTRFRGATDAVQFTEQGRSITLKCDVLLNAEIIPLAGAREFWKATFLLAFQLPIASTKLNFQAC